MDCIVTLTLTNGQEIVLNTNDIHSPNYQKWCFSNFEYVERIMSNGVVLVQDEDDGSITITRYSKYCICLVTFNNACN